MCSANLCLLKSCLNFTKHPFKSFCGELVLFSDSFWAENTTQQYIEQQRSIVLSLLWNGIITMYYYQLLTQFLHIYALKLSIDGWLYTHHVHLPSITLTGWRSVGALISILNIFCAFQIRRKRFTGNTTYTHTCMQHTCETVPIEFVTYFAVSCWEYFPHGITIFPQLLKLLFEICLSFRWC